MMLHSPTYTMPSPPPRSNKRSSPPSLSNKPEWPSRTEEWIRISRNQYSVQQVFTPLFSSDREQFIISCLKSQLNRIDQIQQFKFEFIFVYFKGLFHHMCIFVYLLWRLNGATCYCILLVLAKKPFKVKKAVKKATPVKKPKNHCRCHCFYKM
ncbi:hypothetical protein L2E82_27701 [Cichorium intybus]|uniref:Uncharacterized protein n=1 Tax=Cichorium intybus TaxID=13427 RepID=A0ACB9CU04_CICIN|nr:hypothetical protein L2E82_27701 [Cichorium intybus]